MLFILRAIFWISVVAAFTPPAFTMDEDSAAAEMMRTVFHSTETDAIGEILV